MNPRKIKRVVVISVVSLILLPAVLWQMGVPFVFVSFSKSTSLAPHDYPWTELGWAVFFEEGKDKISNLIHSDPAQLTILQPPSGHLPLEFALVDGENEITELLLFEIDGIYDPLELLRIAKPCIRLREIDHLRMLKSVIPSERQAWYIAQLEKLIRDAGLEDIEPWPIQSEDDQPSIDPVP